MMTRGRRSNWESISRSESSESHVTPCSMPGRGGQLVIMFKTKDKNLSACVLKLAHFLRNQLQFKYHRTDKS